MSSFAGGCVCVGAGNQEDKYVCVTSKRLAVMLLAVFMGEWSVRKISVCV